MRAHFDQRWLGRRIVAVAAAYVLILSTVLANLAAARIAAEAAADPLGIICHAADAGTPSRPGDDGGAGHCIDNCSVCCLTLAAALPPPVALHRAALPIPAARRLSARAVVARLRPTPHRSRAPPQAV